MALWNRDEDKALIELWKEGLSAAIIAERLQGRTRNMVIGRAHRLGMSQPKTQSTYSRISKTMKQLRRCERIERERRQPKPMKAEPLPETPANDIPTVSFQDLEEHQCKWICGEPRNMFDPQFCGDRRAPGKSYCAGHAARAYKPAQPPQQRHEYVLRVPPTRPSMTLAGLNALAEA